MKRKVFLTIFVLSIFLCTFSGIVAEDDGVRLLKQVSQSVARVFTEIGGGWGTGFFISDRYVVTNHHCVSNYLQDSIVGGKGWDKSAVGDTVYIYYSEANRDYVKGTVVQDWPDVDLAVIEIKSSDSKRTQIKLAAEKDIDDFSCSGSVVSHIS